MQLPDACCAQLSLQVISVLPSNAKSVPLDRILPEAPGALFRPCCCPHSGTHSRAVHATTAVAAVAPCAGSACCHIRVYAVLKRCFYILLPTLYCPAFVRSHIYAHRSRRHAPAQLHSQQQATPNAQHHLEWRHTAGLFCTTRCTRSSPIPTAGTAQRDSPHPDLGHSAQQCTAPPPSRSCQVRVFTQTDVSGQMQLSGIV